MRNELEGKKKRKLNAEFQNTGVRRVLVAGVGPDIPENEFNFKLIMEKGQLARVPHDMTGDLKALNIISGCGPCSSAYPCLYCTARRPGNW